MGSEMGQYDAAAIRALESRLRAIERPLGLAGSGDKNARDNSETIAERLGHLASGWQAKANDTKILELLAQYDELDQLCRAEDLAASGMTTQAKLEVITAALPELEASTESLQQAAELSKYINPDYISELPSYIERLRPIELQFAEQSFAGEIVVARANALLNNYYVIMDKLSETFVQWDAALTEMEQNKHSTDVFLIDEHGSTSRHYFTFYRMESASVQPRRRRYTLFSILTREGGSRWMMASTPLYDRGALTLREDGILLRNYYFPTLGAKFVPYSDVTGVEKIVCRIRNSKTWGMSFNRAWWHLDGWFREFRGNPGLLIHTDRITMGISPSPADVDRVEKIIRERSHKDE